MTDQVMLPHDPEITPRGVDDRSSGDLFSRQHLGKFSEGILRGDRDYLFRHDICHRLVHTPLLQDTVSSSALRTRSKGTATVLLKKYSMETHPEKNGGLEGSIRELSLIPCQPTARRPASRGAGRRISTPALSPRWVETSPIRVPAGRSPPR